MSPAAETTFEPVSRPPRRPREESQHDIKVGLRWSAGLHVGVALAILLKHLVFPGTAVTIPPTLRVDLVGLPDVLKKDKWKLNAQLDPKLADALRAAADQANEIKKVELPKSDADKPDPDELVMKREQAGDDIARQKKLKSSLARIKALLKVQTPDDAAARAQPVKGNQLSRGTSLSGDAKESTEPSYYDHVRDRLQENWALPVWLSRQKLSARVQIFINRTGHLHTYRFLEFSGNTQFDEAVKRTITDSEPFVAPTSEVADAVFTDGIVVGFPL